MVASILLLQIEQVLLGRVEKQTTTIGHTQLRFNYANYLNKYLQKSAPITRRANAGNATKVVPERFFRSETGAFANT